MMKPALPALLRAILVLASPSAFAQGTAFTHQGRLEAGGVPAQGAYDFQFAVYAAAGGGTAVAGPLSVENVDVANGVFTVRLDFGPAVFLGPVRWLEIGVRSAGSGTAYAALSPRQEITAAPYAIYAGTAATATTANGVVANGVGTAALVNRAVTSAKIDDRTIQAVDLSLPLLDGTFWKLAGNAGTTPGMNFLGTTDNQALEVRVNNARGLRLEPAVSGPNVIGGASGNAVSLGAGAAGILAGDSNEVTGSFGAIGGGAFNGAAGQAFVGGGRSNQAQASGSVIGGGVSNQALSTNSTIAGGRLNKIHNAENGFIGGGLGNTVHAGHAAVAGGLNNVADGIGAFVGGGHANFATGYGVVGGGVSNQVENAESSIGATISGGVQNRVDDANGAGIGGGRHNWIWLDSDDAAIGGGLSNYVSRASYHATIGGGWANWVSGHGATVGGGNGNEIQRYGVNSTIGGGLTNTIDGAREASIGGGALNRIHLGADYSTVGGGVGNTVDLTTTHGTIGGGQSNVVNSGDWATVPGGRDNLAGGNYSLAAGRRAKAVHSGTFVWADDTDADFASTAAKQFAVRADNGVMIQSTATALDLRGGGAVRVAGAGIGTATPAFTHRAAAVNITGAETRLDHPQCNARSNAILLVTHVFNPAGTSPGTRNDHAVGVYYTGTRWAIYNLDGAAMPVGASFNVLVVQP